MAFLTFTFIDDTHTRTRWTIDFYYVLSRMKYFPHKDIAFEFRKILWSRCVVTKTQLEFSYLDDHNLKDALFTNSYAESETYIIGSSQKSEFLVTISVSNRV